MHGRKLNSGGRVLSQPKLWAGSLLFALVFAVGEANANPGLLVRYTSSQENAAVDFTSTDDAALFVSAEAPATPFLPTGPFTAEFEGFVSVDLRDHYHFRAELNGDIKLEINGRPVLEGSSEGSSIESTSTVRLNRGPNQLKLIFNSPKEGDAFLRLFWSSLDFSWEPVPATALSRPAPDAEFELAAQRRLGRALFTEFQCIRCHQADLRSKPMPELRMEGPDLAGMGSRRHFAWLARWIADPLSERPSARMPRMLHGPESERDARDIAAFLMSLKTDASPQPEASNPTPERIAAGERLFQELHCGACHEPHGRSETDPTKISLQHVREKFAPGMLARFLEKPDAHHAWTRMPDFKLSPGEADDLAAWLDSLAEAPKLFVPPSDRVWIERGRKLVQTTGCLNCHQLPLENEFAAKNFSELASSRWTMGCLAEERDSSNLAPRFPFTPEERQALRAFAHTDHSSLSRDVPGEFAARQVQRLNCLNCHGSFDGFPALAHLGGKLKPEWTEKLLAGQLPDKPRPWLSARMPSYPQYARDLARGLAAQHGYPPETPAEPPLDEAAAQLGRRMVGAAGGFSCVACHPVGTFNAVPLDTEAAGINLAQAAERLLYPYYHRWMNQPLRIDPETKMPAYFDQGRSLLQEYYEGDAHRQIRAIWEYLRLGARMPSPVEEASGP